jgi:hypothetical protein
VTWGQFLKFEREGKEVSSFFNRDPCPKGSERLGKRFGFSKRDLLFEDDRRTVNDLLQGGKGNTVLSRKIATEGALFFLSIIPDTDKEDSISPFLLI